LTQGWFGYGEEDKFMAARNGEPIVQITIYEQWKRERAAFFDRLREIQERVDLTPDKADRLANEVVQAVRNS
jgi:hypothetical protein